MGFKTIRKEDWAAIDNFLLDKRIAGKKYRELHTGELNNLAVKLRSMRDKGYRAKEVTNSHETK
jgi:hypothetical protein